MVIASEDVHMTVISERYHQVDVDVALEEGSACWVHACACGSLSADN